MLGNPSATSTVPSPISTKRSGSIPHPPAPYNNRGNVWYAQRDFDRAIADFDQAIRLNSELADAYNGRGRAWLAKRDLDRAIADSDRAIDAYYSRAAIWGKKGYFNHAIAEFDAALKIFSQPCEIALRPWSRQAPEGRRQRQRRHRRGQGDPGRHHGRVCAVRRQVSVHRRSEKGPSPT
ncbi:MAG TPA: tetratricopeptide repeat protein [Methyloceanibacter sp.]|nr:tetratricopeptide repeat protein [Methyloceanibacter sp.]